MESSASREGELDASSYLHLTLCNSAQGQEEARAKGQGFHGQPCPILISQGRYLGRGGKERPPVYFQTDKSWRLDS